jgi:hypothetical protein
MNSRGAARFGLLYVVWEYELARPNESASLAEVEGANLPTFMKRWSQQRLYERVDS